MAIEIKTVPIGEEWKDVLLIAYDGEEMVGNCRVWDNYSKLTELYVIPTKRGKLVAELLLIEGAALAKVHGNKVLRGFCKKRLLLFYHKYGLRVVEVPDDKDEGMYIVEYDIP